MAGPRRTPAGTGALLAALVVAALVVAVLAATLGALAPAAATSHHTPRGRIDVVALTPGGVRVAGWALDEDTADPIPVHVYVNGTLAKGLLASKPRTDIGALFPALGPNHGFDDVVLVGASPATICLYLINRPSGTNPRLGCTTVDQSPVGNLDTFQRRPGADVFTTRISGWALDPNTAGSIPVHVYDNGALLGPVLADEPRPDLAGRYPAHGQDHGFVQTYQLGPGAHRLCAYAIDTGPGSNRSLGCRDLLVGTLPVGVVDVLRRTGGTSVRAAGWTVDPDSSLPIDVEVRANGLLRGTTAADVVRSTIGSYDTYYGTAHGYDVTVPLGTSAPTQVCVYAVNVFQGSGTRLLGCTVV